MRVCLYVAIWMAGPALLAAQDPADAAWQLTLRLSQVRRHAVKALQDQPDYTCLATFDRYRWLVNEREERKLDTVRVEVAYVGERELYAWPGADKFSDISLTSLVGGGLTGDGDFAVHAHNVFVSNNGTETWAGEEPGNGRWGPTDRKLWRWNYRISHFQSGWVVGYADARQTVGSEGSFWVDPQTLDLVRMETHATDFLAGFPLKAVVSTVDYGRVHIGEREVLLPVRGELKTTTQEGTESRNLIEYSNCRQYTGQSSISFGALPEPAAGTPAAPPVTPVEARLPAGLALKIRLSNDIVAGQATVGDAIEGKLAGPLRDGKNEIAPKGATVRGRVRLLTRETTAGTLSGAPGQFIELGLVFDELELEGRLYHFTAILKSFDTVVPGVRMNMTEDRANDRTSVVRKVITPTDVPGVSVFFIDARGSGLPKGTLMTWTTGR